MGYGVEAGADILRHLWGGPNLDVETASEILRVPGFQTSYRGLTGDAARLTNDSIHSNVDRCDGEEDVPDWFFEDGYVFLPEEMEPGLRINDRELIGLFRHDHGDLLGKHSGRTC